MAYRAPVWRTARKRLSLSSTWPTSCGGNSCNSAAVAERALNSAMNATAGAPVTKLAAASVNTASGLFRPCTPLECVSWHFRPSGRLNFVSHLIISVCTVDSGASA